MKQKTFGIATYAVSPYLDLKMFAISCCERFLCYKLFFLLRELSLKDFSVNEFPQ